MEETNYCESLLKTGFCSVAIVQENGDTGHTLCAIRLYSNEPPMRCPKIRSPKEWLCGNCGQVNVGGTIECESCHGVFTEHLPNCRYLTATGFCALDIIEANGDVGHAKCALRRATMIGRYGCPNR